MTKNKRDDKYRVHSSENFNTLFIGEKKKEQKKFTKKAISNLVDLLSGLSNKHLKEDVLSVLRKEDGKDILLEALSEAKDEKQVIALTAACWESGLDFSEHISFFITLALAHDPEICIEVLSVIQEMKGKIGKDILEEQRSRVRKGIEAASSGKQLILQEILSALAKMK